MAGVRMRPVHQRLRERYISAACDLLQCSNS